MVCRFRPDGKLLISGSDDRSIKVWNIDERCEEFALRGHTNWIRSVALAQMEGLQLVVHMINELMYGIWKAITSDLSGWSFSNGNSISYEKEAETDELQS